jgi:hypothetical protein
MESIVAKHINTHEFVDRGDGLCAHRIGITSCGYPSADEIHGHHCLPADWFQDSSLETWFPLTAEELKNKTALALNLAILVRRLVRKMHQLAPTDPIIQQAMDFLSKNGLQGSVLRAEASDHDRDWYQENDPQSLVDSINEANAGNPRIG